MKAIDIAFATLTLLASCSSNHTKQPGELNDCTPVGDAGCNARVVGGGSMQGPADSGSTADADASGSTQLQCGSVQSVLNPTNMMANMACLTCIPLNCCGADMACGIADCIPLLERVLSCAQGDTVCVMQAEATYPTGLAAYQDVVACLSMQCPSCPVLQE